MMKYMAVSLFILVLCTTGVWVIAYILGKGMPMVYLSLGMGCLASVCMFAVDPILLKYTPYMAGFAVGLFSIFFALCMSIYFAIKDH